MTPLLLFEPLAQFVHELVPAEFLQARLFVGAEVAPGDCAQPLLGKRDVDVGQFGDIAKVLAEGLVESIVVGFVLDQTGAGDEVEVVDRMTADTIVQPFEQGQEFARRHGELLRLEVEEEVDQHGRILFSN